MSNPEYGPPREGGRDHFGYIPVDAPLSFAESLSLPYELPISDAACRVRFGVPGRPVVIHTQARELEP